jgi:hypothetical protein
VSDVVRTDDELAVRAALADMTVGQPELPVGRVAGVRRKHARRRQLQAVAGACAVAIVAVGAVALGGTFHTSRSTEPLHRSVPSWALPWDDQRDGTVPPQALASLVTRWTGDQLEKAPLPRTQPVQMSPVVWYLGQRIPGTDQVVAVFEAADLHAGALPLTRGPRLVVAHGTLSDVQNVGNGDGWSYIDVAAPGHDFTGFLGGYVPVDDANGGFRNIVWLLTSPSYRHAQTSVGGYDLHDGYVTFDAGRLRIRVEASIQDASGRYPAGGYVGIPGAPSREVPTLANPEPLAGVPSTNGLLGEEASQGTSSFSDGSAHQPAGRPTTIYARCYAAGGSRFIRVAIDQDGPGKGVRIPCDDRQHVVPGNPTGPRNTPVEGERGTAGHGYFVQASQLIAWRVAVVIN